MKRGNMLNSEISAVISRMGHTDGLTIGDAGLPISDECKRIDLAVRPGLPKFTEVLETVLEELCVEKILLAEEIRSVNPEGMEEILGIMAEYEKKTGYKPAMTFVPHEEFKKMTASTKAVVRTGEVMPYANIILYSGVTF
ncbi:MAG: D-ribose pyranase [Spirochaetaceae bacterium 4572_59]|nr:MAG: D-ribose pyranase [Spirochaetaceae bacterium 4572_59]